MRNKIISNLEKIREEKKKQKKESLNSTPTPKNYLLKGNNISIIIKKSKNHIKLLNNNCINKISSLSNIAIEKYIKYNSGYELPETDSDNDSRNSLKGMAKLKERLLEDSHDDYNHRKNKISRSDDNTNKINKFHLYMEREDKNSVILLDEVKTSVKTILNKEGNSIGKNYELIKMTWKNLYKWLLLFPLNILFGLIYFIYKDNYGFSFAEIICFLIIFLICLVCMNGNEKMIAKKKVNFNAENIMLNLISFLCIYILICTNTDIIEHTAYCFLNENYVLVHAIFFTLIVFCCVLIYLNKKMMVFYHKYSQIVESGVLLTDRS